MDYQGQTPPHPASLNGKKNTLAIAVLLASFVIYLAVLAAEGTLAHNNTMLFLLAYPSFMTVAALLHTLGR